MPKYEPVLDHVNCDCSIVALEEAAQKIGPAFVYDLYVCPTQLVATRSRVKALMLNNEANVLAPHINLHGDPDMTIFEWYLSANGKNVGSGGAF